METCNFNDFIQVLKPWLDSDYIRKGYIDNDGTFRLFFADGGERIYRIDDCTEVRLKEVYQTMLEKGIPLEKAE